MDKFGIFNLLNSFFSLTNQKNQATENQPAPSGDLLSGLLSSFTKNLSTTQSQNVKAEKPATLSPHPLQEQMLSTVVNHDALVKRVKEKQKTF